MITVITEKPNRSIEIKGYGADSYVDKNGKKIYRVYGIIEPGSRGRLVSRDGKEIQDLYTDDTTIIIYRSEDRSKVLSCKNMLDFHVARNAPVFSVEQFKAWLENPMPPENHEPEQKIEGDMNAN